MHEKLLESGETSSIGKMSIGTTSAWKKLSVDSRKVNFVYFLVFSVFFAVSLSSLEK